MVHEFVDLDEANESNQLDHLHDLVMVKIADLISVAAFFQSHDDERKRESSYEVESKPSLEVVKDYLFSIHDKNPLPVEAGVEAEENINTEPYLLYDVKCL